MPDKSIQTPASQGIEEDLSKLHIAPSRTSNSPNSTGFDSANSSHNTHNQSNTNARSNTQQKTDSDSDSDDMNNNNSDDFVPVGFDYDGFNSMAEGILHLEKPKSKTETKIDSLSYEMLLLRIEKYLKPSDREAERKTKIPISIKRDGATKTSLNIAEICQVLGCEVAHMKQFIEVELSVNCSIDGDNRLILKGIFPEAQLQKIIRSYIKQYISCGVCGSLHTELKREDKLLFKHCLTCNATQSVNSIQQGYKAITTKRSVLRRKAEV
ncbi:translation initiation factor 2 subunit 2 [Nematocida homosporus]|uniref:translation initiation factor 2 subunit 2 n=1 Tax=Nematocida homosporus TaxID=1912981 RepID=UPI00221E70BF|nr:translation initiation factor 2 subunit 2 [Nematocida homosporus]KAI5184751.1 translation initiation factor 2 subunit 2 [Nematocida homosporus]